MQQQLNYIKSLGAEAIWLSPLLKNLPFDVGSYHGYGIHDFLRPEPRFANNPAEADDELRALVDAAHHAGLYVMASGSTRFGICKATCRRFSVIPCVSSP